MTQRFPHKYFVFIAAVLFGGCLSPSNQMERFVGKTSTEVLAHWGKPQTTAPDGQGGELWIYEVHRQLSTGGYSTTTMNTSGSTIGNYYSGSGTATTTYNPPSTRRYTVIRTFFINSDGIVYRYTWKGL